METATSVEVAKAYCLQFERFDLKVMSDYTKLALGLDEVGCFLNKRGLLDIPCEASDMIEAVKRIKKADFMSIAQDYHPSYRGRARLSLVDVSESGGALRSHAVSKIYQL